MKQAIYFLLGTFILFSLGCSGGKTALDSSKEAKETSETAMTESKPPKPDIKSLSPGTITFAAANDRYSAEGTFKNWKFLSVKMDKNDIKTWDAMLEIDLTSIWEKSDKLTQHLKAPDYFNVGEYGKATVAINNVQSKGGTKYVADMTLSMMDQEQTLRSDFILVSEKPMRVRGTAKVDRSIFKIGVENTSVPDLIEVTFDTVVKK